MTAAELERMMVATFGEDFREKSVHGWPLASAFEECGLTDPKAPRASSGAYGLWQIMPVRERRP